jgi:tellurite resistance protein TerC
MQAVVEHTLWRWVIFVICVLLFLALDLGVVHRRAREVSFKEALAWTTLWFGLSMAFYGGMAFFRGQRDSVEFLTGYFIEVSLSMDNIFVIALIFTYFRVPNVYQHRILFWGVIGALVMRGLMICLGAALITRFDWILYIFGAFIVMTGVRMLVAKGAEVDPEKNIVVRAARKFLPVTSDLHGQKLITRLDGRMVFTPLFLVLLMVETCDLLFAVDSIPAIFGVTRKPFIVFTSNVFAVLGLRSLFVVLGGAIGLFRYLKTGISVVLVFIGVKMLIDPHDNPPRWFQWDIPDGGALLFVLILIAVSILASIIVTRRERERGVVQK